MLTQGTAPQAPVAETQTQTTQTPGQPATPAAAPAAEAPKEKDQFAEKLQILSQKERSIYRQRAQMEQMAKQIEAEKAELERFKALKASAKKNPLDFIKEADLSYDELTQYVLNGGKQTEKNELEELRNEFKSYREQQQTEKQKQEQMAAQAQAQAEAQRIEEFKGEIGEFVQANKATFELCAERDATEDIFATINDAYVISLNDWHQNGRVGRPPSPMDIKQAAEIVEEFFEQEVLRLSATNKIKSKLQPQADQNKQGMREAPKTLTNSMASSAASVLPAATEADRIKRALAKLG